jgi:Tol biopolymer transport system component
MSLRHVLRPFASFCLLKLPRRRQRPGMIKGAPFSILLVATLFPPQLPAPTLKVFAPGVISNRDVFGVAFTKDSKTVYFCETDKDIKHIQIMVSYLTRNTWSEPAPATFSPGTFRDIDPFVTPDGRHLIFESNRPAPGRDGSRTDFDAYILDLNNSKSTPVALTAINTESNEVFVSSSTNGDLYFASDRPGGEGSNDLYWAKKSNAGYDKAINLRALNTPASDGNPAISPSGGFIIFVRDGDLYSSKKAHGEWSTPEKLPLVNTADETEYAPAFSPDGKTLYFTRTTFKDGKRIKPGTIYSIALRDLGLAGSTR